MLNTNIGRIFGMPILTLFFSLAWVILLLFIFKQMKDTRKEVAFLPPLKSRQFLKQQEKISIGKKVTEFISLEYQKAPYTILLITLPNCAYCQSAIEGFIGESRGDFIPFINLLTIADNQEKEIKDYLQLYETDFPIIPVPLVNIAALGIEGFPTFLLINSFGEIVNETGWSKKIIQLYRKQIK